MENSVSLKAKAISSLSGVGSSYILVVDGPEGDNTESQFLSVSSFPQMSRLDSDEVYCRMNWISLGKISLLLKLSIVVSYFSKEVQLEPLL